MYSYYLHPLSKSSTSLAAKQGSLSQAREEYKKGLLLCIQEHRDAPCYKVQRTVSVSAPPPIRTGKNDPPPESKRNRCHFDYNNKEDAAPHRAQKQPIDVSRTYLFRYPTCLRYLLHHQRCLKQCRLSSFPKHQSYRELEQIRPFCNDYCWDCCRET